MTSFQIISISLVCIGLTASSASSFAASPSVPPVTVTANVTLQRGHIIEHGDVNIVPKNQRNTSDVLGSYIGQQMRRTVYAGAKVNLTYVDKPTLVRRNARINMVYRIGRLEISATGRALEQGGEGDLISIMNLDSKRRVKGYILADGSVEAIK